MNNFCPSLSFRFVAIQMRYQLVTLKRFVMLTFYSLITVFEQISMEMYENNFRTKTDVDQCSYRKNMCVVI